NHLARRTRRVSGVDHAALRIAARGRAHFLDRGRRAGEAELRGVGGEGGRAHGFDLPRLGLLDRFRLDPDRLRHALGAGQQRGHRALDVVVALVALALGDNPAVFDPQLTYACDLCDPEQLGDLRADLAGFGVERV